jgi:hypothetical protein
MGHNPSLPSAEQLNRVDVPQSRKVLAEIPAGVPDEQAKIVGGSTARVYNFDVAKLTVPA